MTAQLAIDRPWTPAPEIVLDLPVPPSTNALWRSDRGRTPHISAAYKEWMRQADSYVLLARSEARRKGMPTKITGSFQLHITLSEDHTSIDTDNIKAIADFLRKRAGVIDDDDRKHMRRITSEYGYAPMGCRIVIRGMDNEGFVPAPDEPARRYRE